MTSTEHTSGTDRVAEAASGSRAEIIVNIQGDEPLIEPGMIDAAVRPLIDDPALRMCTLKTPITSQSELADPNVVKVVTDKDGYALYFSRSIIPNGAAVGAAVGKGGAPAFKHIGLYVYRRDFLLELSALEPTPLENSEKLEQLRALENGFRIMVVDTPFNPVAVDTEEDLVEVRRIIGSMRNDGENKGEDRDL
jgi:3-deoxy-manno-octulosonate cytidylyltransferase (CMP-KDO synthetase)